MNGNDIVDLRTAKIPGGLKGHRYLDKIFSKEEHEILNCGRVGVWALWAMKEAVYKAHHRRFNLSRSFDPKRILVKVREASEDSYMAEAKYQGYDYFGSGILTTQYVYCTATCFPQKKIYNQIYNTSSRGIKTQLLQTVSQKLDIVINDLNIVKDNYSIPHIKYQDMDLKLPFSISHHGKFAAFSFQLMNY